MLSTDLQAFFQSYESAFDRLDGEAVADLYAIPSGILSDSGHVHWQTREPIAHNMVALCEQYRRKGFVSTRFDLRHCIIQGENFAVVDVAWTMRWTGDQADWHFNTTYNLRRTPEGWRVALCTAYSEPKLAAVPPG